MARSVAADVSVLIGRGGARPVFAPGLASRRGPRARQTAAVVAPRPKTAAATYTTPLTYGMTPIAVSIAHPARNAVVGATVPVEQPASHRLSRHHHTDQ